MPASPRQSAPAKTAVPPRQNIREYVYAVVRERMQRGDIGLDERLVDHEIAAELNVSRMPVREALLQLKSEGYLEGTSRGFVLPQFRPEDIANIFEVRLLLEPPAAASACRSATVEGLGRMSLAATEAEQSHRKANVPGYIEAISAFRTAWVGMVPNAQLVQIVNRLRDHAQAVRIATLKDREFRLQSLQHTREILEAFLRHDGEAASERVAHNLRVSAASYYAKQESLLRAQARAQGATAKPVAKRLAVTSSR
jgi:DNA-binding GntR family transcriptional regulator